MDQLASPTFSSTSPSTKTFSLALLSAGTGSFPGECTARAQRFSASSGQDRITARFRLDQDALPVSYATIIDMNKVLIFPNPAGMERLRDCREPACIEFRDTKVYRTPSEVQAVADHASSRFP